MKLRILLFSIILCFFSCNDDIEITQQRVFFEIHYVNYAWSYVNHGILIDSLGNVNGYHLSQKNNWNYPDSLGYISRKEMNENFSHCDTVIHHISKDSLQYFVNKIDNAARGIVSDPVGVMADAGIMEYIAYVFDKKRDRYKKVVLYQWGDQQITHDAPEAAELYAWLMRMGQYNK